MTLPHSLPKSKNGPLVNKSPFTRSVGISKKALIVSRVWLQDSCRHDAFWGRVRPSSNRRIANVHTYVSSTTAELWNREHHRHQYKANPMYVEKLNTSGMAFTRRDEWGGCMQFMALPSTSSALSVRATRRKYQFNKHSHSLLACRCTRNSARVRLICLLRCWASSQWLCRPDVLEQ